MGVLFARVASFSNLLEAARLASRGKRFRPNVAAFSLNLEEELQGLQRELVTRTYRPGPYRTFLVREKKPRLISAAPFRDRVMHHALCNVIEPLFDRGFLFDSYACRKGKGTHAAVERASSYARRFRYVLKCDVEKYFPSIDHEILMGLIAERIWDEQVLWLVRTIVQGSNPQPESLHYFPGDGLFTPYERRRGIPIGNQTSQFFANVYLDKLDHYVKEVLRVPGYVRYVDDLLVFDDDKERLHEIRAAIEAFGERLRLRLHPRKCFVAPASAGVTFLGYRIFPTHRRLDAGNVRRFKRRLRRYGEAVAKGRMLEAQRRECIRSWISHAAYADTARLCARILGKTAQ
ncbi:reverse transcriptase domain-containing protein [Nitrospira sp. BLG_2]|uniref:reverse transcriptase domain-containing protein n=1 Tax=Nitrospira sp. BLG_2 TaxID=3397507 RepID=UPI003B9A7C7F